MGEVERLAAFLTMVERVPHDHDGSLGSSVPTGGEG
jgi:hypothetical protein